jgi:hypothetical protein
MDFLKVGVRRRALGCSRKRNRRLETCPFLGDREMKMCWAVVAVLTVLAMSPAMAGIYTYTPSDPDLEDLTHQKSYLWGIDTSDVPDDECIIGASVFFNNIRNWNTESNDLYITLLDSAPLGVTVYYDNQYWLDSFSGLGVSIQHYEDLSASAQDLTYNFDASELATLGSYISDDNVGLGIDPDCHFYNCGVQFQIETEPCGSPIPEPMAGSILLGGLGVILARRRRS